MKRFEKVLIGLLIIFLFGITYFLFPVKPIVSSPELAKLYAGQYRVVNYEYISVSTTKGLTVSKYYDATTNKILADYAFMTVTTGGLTFCVDGTVATSIQCHKVEVGQNITLTSYDELKKFNANKQSATGGIGVTYKKWYDK